jgi:hypothetical protein
MKQFSIIGKSLVVALLTVVLGGCTTIDQPGNGQLDDQQNGQPTAPAMPPKTERPPQTPLEPNPILRLKTLNFGGTLVTRAADVTPLENGFTLPIYLEDVVEADFLDTVGLKLTLPEGIRLQEVNTTPGFTAQLEGMNGANPVIFYLPVSISADSYQPVVAGSEPIFTLQFSGEPTENIIFQGSFFQTNGTLYHTERGELQLTE